MSLLADRNFSVYLFALETKFRYLILTDLLGSREHFSGGLQRHTSGAIANDVNLLNFP